MLNTITSLSLTLLTLLTLAAWVIAVRRLRSAAAKHHAVVENILIALVSIGGLGLFVSRWLIHGDGGQPLLSHVDGLLLISVLLATVILFLQTRPRMSALGVFALPMLALILAWGICAAVWTYRPFNIDTLHPIWRGIHLVGVYLGTAFAAIAAISGGMYLHVHHRLRHKHDPHGQKPLASLEKLETLIIRAAAVGFALLTLGLVAGLVVVSDHPTLAEQRWWLTPKILLACSAWLIFAIVMNVRYASTFRGTRAAILSIAGLILLLATYSAATALPGPTFQTTPDPTSATPLRHDAMPIAAGKEVA